MARYENEHGEACWPNAEPIGLDSFLRGYVATMLFANTFAGDGEQLESRDVRGEVDPSDDARKEAREDCIDFLASFDADDADAELVAEWNAYVADYGFEDAGSDFALSRNGHGAGFFDKDADRVQRHAKAWGSRSWIVQGERAERFE